MSGSLVGKLKALSRQRLSADALDDLISEINSGSDRSVAIVWAAMVEDALRIALTKLMPDLSSDTEKRFFEGEGPLSSFSSKILLGFALQTVKTIERTDLDKIREI